ncbi:MAG: hypothetical protein K2L22_10685 [Muribaculaceae bacterium]|nr:hypothetical protein [Muribaculaceae bacterium]
MKAKHLYLLLALFTVMWGAPSCSDNVDIELKPTTKERSLILEALGQTTSDNGTPSISLNLLAKEDTIPVKVVCNTLWQVEVENSESDFCSVDAYGGQGEGEFTIIIKNNIDEARECKISVCQIDGIEQTYNWLNTASIVINQEAGVIVPSSVDIFPAEGADRQRFQIKTNSFWMLSVKYDSELANEFITIIPGDGMSESELSSEKKIYVGDSDAKFDILLSNNLTSISRKAYLNLQTEYGNYLVCVTQQGSNYIFDVSPTITRTVIPEGDNIEFNIYSPDYGWRVWSDCQWIKCPDSGFESSDENVTINVTVDANDDMRLDMDRAGTIIFTSDNPTYLNRVVKVIQRSYDLTFNMSVEGFTEVPFSGASYELAINSHFDWTLTSPDWIQVNETHGVASKSERKIMIEVLPNSTNESRTGFITLIPKATEYTGGVVVYPDLLGIEPIRVEVSQVGRKEAVISIPWLEDFKQTSATLAFNFYSPYNTIVEAGLEWRIEDGLNADTMSVTPSNGTDCTVSFELTGLQAATKYIARGYVKDSEARIKYSQWSFPFATIHNLEEE